MMITEKHEYWHQSSITLPQVRVDSMMKVAEIEEAEKQKMRNKYVIDAPLFFSFLFYSLVSVLISFSSPHWQSTQHTSSPSPSPLVFFLILSPFPSLSPFPFYFHAISYFLSLPLFFSSFIYSCILTFWICFYLLLLLLFFPSLSFFHTTHPLSSHLASTSTLISIWLYISKPSILSHLIIFLFLYLPFIYFEGVRR